MNGAATNPDFHVVAYAGAQRLQAGQVDTEDTRVRPRWPMEELPPIEVAG